MEKCLSIKEIWEYLQDLHSKGSMVVTSNQEYVAKKNKDEPDKTFENKDEGKNCIKEDNEEISKVDIEIDLKTELIDSLEEISNLKRENEELKKQVQDVLTMILTRQIRSCYFNAWSTRKGWGSQQT